MTPDTPSQPIGGARVHRSPSAIAQDIRKHMPRATSTWIYAREYVGAMEALVSWNDFYGLDSGREIGLRFLCNVGNWRGPEARRIKAEIRAALGVKA